MLSKVRQDFESIQGRLGDLWQQLKSDRKVTRTAVAVPSLSLDLEGIGAPEGMIHFEERMLYLLNLLRHPHNRLILVTSRPLPPSLIDYHLHLLPGVPYSHARERLRLFSAHDWSDQPLSAKLLARPALLERIRRAVGQESRAYLTCYNSSPLEQELAVRLGLPILGTDPRHHRYGSKSEARRLFEQAEVACAPGRSNLRTLEDIGRAIMELGPGQRRVVIKQNQGVSGLGNATLPLQKVPLDSLEGVLRVLPGEVRCPVPWPQFLARFERLGGLVEAFVEGDPVSVQLLLSPDGEEVQLMATHEEMTDKRQGYVGCRMPARPRWTGALHQAGLKVGRQLASLGVCGRMEVDFLASPGRLVGLDINLRKGHSTYPLRSLHLLVGGRYDLELGRFITGFGESRCYVSTDKLTSPLFAGLLAEDLIDIATWQGLHYSSATHTGAVFHMLGAVSRYGRVGVTCIEREPEEAQDLYERCLRRLEEQATGWEWLE